MPQQTTNKEKYKIKKPQKKINYITSENLVKEQN